MLPDSHVKEKYSKAYLTSLVARAGFLVEFSESGNDFGLDAKIQEMEYDIDGKCYFPTDITLKVQCKSSASWRSLSSDTISFALKNKNYYSGIEINQI